VESNLIRPPAALQQRACSRTTRNTPISGITWSEAYSQHLITRRGGRVPQPPGPLLRPLRLDVGLLRQPPVSGQNGCSRCGQAPAPLSASASCLIFRHRPLSGRCQEKISSDGLQRTLRKVGDGCFQGRSDTSSSLLRAPSDGKVVNGSNFVAGRPHPRPAVASEQLTCDRR